MSKNNKTNHHKAQYSIRLANRFREKLETFIHSFLQELDTFLDKRLVHTFFATLQAIVMHRNQSIALLLSELGGYILSPEQAPAGTKRISNLLRSTKWEAALLHKWFWKQAQQRHQELLATQKIPLLIWDESAYEKPETLQNEDLCAVRSSRAQRMKRIRPGFYNPPAKPIFVPGLHWIAVLMTAANQQVSVACMRWWSSRGSHATANHDAKLALLGQLARAWKDSVIHVFDREYGNNVWTTILLEHGCRFIVRWNKGYKLLDWNGEEKKAGKMMTGQRSWEYKMVSGRGGRRLKIGVTARCVNLVNEAQPLWLIAARVQGKESWYLLTSEVVPNAEKAWEIVFAYGKRWEIEEFWRYSKSELGIQSPRVWTWERREKLLLIVSLAYAFLLSLLQSEQKPLCDILLRLWAHRTGKRNRLRAVPLYRLRAALARLWLQYLEPPGLLPLNSG